MNEDSANNFEKELRRRLRPVDAPEGFTGRLLAALPAEHKPVVAAFTPRAARPSARQFGMPAALAASLLVAVFAGVHLANERAYREEQRGIAASEQLMQALRVTSQKLDLAYEAVNSPPPAGDEENRS
jgi:negative regulator of sigma E activity